MKKVFLIPILLLATGCQFTQRLDALHEEIVQMNAKLDETNRILTNVETATTRLGKLVP
jgi:hypothetical protein